MHDHEHQYESSGRWLVPERFLPLQPPLSQLGAVRARFTCLKPGLLVEQYIGYAYGNPSQTRFVVLGKEKLENADALKDLAVIEDAPQLLQDFLKFLQS